MLQVHASDPDLDAELEYSITEVRAADKTGLALKDNNIYDYQHAFRSVKNQSNKQLYLRLT